MEFSAQKITTVLLALLPLQHTLPATNNNPSLLPPPPSFLLATNSISPSAPVAHNQNNDIYSGLRMFSEVVDLVDKKSYRPVNFKEFMEACLKAGVAYCEAHSAFFPAQSFKQSQEQHSGKFSGIGVSVISKSQEDDELVITDVIEEGPAAKSGLLGGDKIVAIEDEPLRGLSTDEVIGKLKGERNTKVRIKIIRDKKPLSFTVTRDFVKNEISFAYYFPTYNVHYLKLQMFSSTAPELIANLLKAAQKQQSKGIIIDLRRNPGGVLETAIETASLFLRRGSVVASTRTRGGEIIESFTTQSKPIFKNDVPMFILIDNFTASVSEIVSGCLKHYADNPYDLGNGKKSKEPIHHQMIFLLGTPTYGKGSVQEVMPLSNGCALKLTTMLYYLPGGDSIQAVGIQPDFIVKPKIIPENEIKWLEELSGREVTLKRHITRSQVEGKTNDKPEKPAEKKSAPKKEKKEKPLEERRQEALSHDIQIKAAINMINLLNIARDCTPQLVSTRPKALEFIKKHYTVDEPMMKMEKVK